jgi:hypothetical protein
MVLIARVCLFKFLAFLSFFTKKLFCHNILFSFEYNKWWKWMNWRLKKSAYHIAFHLWTESRQNRFCFFAFSLATCNNFLSIFSVFFLSICLSVFFYLAIFHILFSLSLSAHLFKFLVKKINLLVFVHKLQSCLQLT